MVSESRVIDNLANSNRRAVIFSPELEKKINNYLGPDKDFLNFSDFTLTACRCVLEQYQLQEMDKVYKKMTKDLSGEQIDWNLPFEPIDFLKKEKGSSGAKILVTFPKGLLVDLSRLAVLKGLRGPELIRYCLEYYLRQLENRKLMYAEEDAALIGALSQAQKDHLTKMGIIKRNKPPSDH